MTNIPAGTYTLTAKATDANNMSTTSSVVTVTVSAPSFPPTVSITSPANNSTLTAGSSMTITASASETNGTIASVAFYNGTTLLATDTASPYSYTMTGLSAGSYTLTVKATDANGVSTTSGPVTVTVNALPAISITSPANNSSVTAGSNLTITASASETNGTIASVAFYEGSVLLGTSTTAPYSLLLTNLSAGLYSFTAKATDTNGASTTSSSVSLTVINLSAPTVSITVPASGSIYSVNSGISIVASASETNGTITQVSFYANGSLIGTSFTSPYSITWVNSQTGTYTLTAVATDALGVSTTSSPVSISLKKGHHF